MVQLNDKLISCKRKINRKHKCFDKRQNTHWNVTAPPLDVSMCCLGNHRLALSRDVIAFYKQTIINDDGQFDHLSREVCFLLIKHKWTIVLCVLTECSFVSQTLDTASKDLG